MSLRETVLGSTLRIVGVVVLALVVLVAGGFAVGVFGPPSVESVDNEFGEVNESATEVETAITVTNPNPVGSDVLGVSVDYAVEMNDVELAAGEKDGLGVGPGTSTVNLTTHLDNQQIPVWWVEHIKDGERSSVTIDTEITSSTLLGQSVAVSPSPSPVETDFLAAVNSRQERPIDVGATPANPDLVITETRGEWGTVEGNTTPIQLEFDVLNPRGDGPSGRIPFVVTKIDYTVRMNDIVVGEGSTEDRQVIQVGETKTVRTTAAIQAERLDEWWVSHLENGQRTELVIEFRPTVELEDPVTGETITKKLPTPITYRTTVETNIFGGGS